MKKQIKLSKCCNAPINIDNYCGCYPRGFCIHCNQWCEGGEEEIKELEGKMAIRRKGAILREMEELKNELASLEERVEEDIINQRIKEDPDLQTNK